MQRVKITKKCGNAEVGTIFVQGLHGIPDYDYWKDYDPEKMYWEEGLDKSEDAFLPVNVLWGTHEGKEYSYAEVIK